MIYSDKIPIDKDSYEAHIRSFAETLDERISFLEGKLDDVEESTRKIYEEQLARLRDKRDSLLKKIKTLEEAGEKKWNKIHSEMDDKLEDEIRDIESTYKKISDKFVYLFDKVNEDDEQG